jgi:hypothetical protein
MLHYAGGYWPRVVEKLVWLWREREIKKGRNKKRMLFAVIMLMTKNIQRQC